MDTASEVLVIIVSSVLVIFLVAAIVATIYAIKVMKQVRTIVAQAESVVDSVEAAASTFQKAASPLALLKVVGNIVEQANRIRRKKG
jgi:hypothetical protein